MKKVEAIIRPNRLEEVSDALADLEVPGVTVSEAKGFGREERHGIGFDGDDTVVELLPRVRIEALLADDQVEGFIAALRAAAGTGKCGDGVISVIDVERVVRIRTGEEGEQAL